MMKTAYNFKKIEKKWQKKWEKAQIFQVKESKKKKFYVLEMYPYPSGSGLHMGHAFNYTIGDIYARFKRMQGFDVLYPMGYDSFGLPAENAAVEEGAHPKTHTEKSVRNFIKQQKELGLSYDWSRVLMTHKPDYYRWNQFFFLKFLEKGLAYRKKAPVNWCGKCKTVLANEQVHSGKCWRHPDAEVKLKEKPRIEEEKQPEKEKPLDIFDREKPKKVKRKNLQRENKFFNRVKEFLSEKSIGLRDIVSFHKNEITLRISIDGEEKLLIAYNKKRINEDDIIRADKKAKESNLPYMVLSLGGPTKKINALIDAIKNLISMEKLK